MMRKLVFLVLLFCSFVAFGEEVSFVKGDYVVSYDTALKYPGWTDYSCEKRKDGLAVVERFAGSWELKKWRSGLKDPDYANCVGRILNHKYVMVVLPDGSVEWWFHYSDDHIERCK